MVEGSRPRLVVRSSDFRETPLPTRSHSLYSDRRGWFLWQIRHFRANMQTPSILTLSFTALLMGVGWAGIRSAQALQDTPVPSVTPAKENGSGESSEKSTTPEATPEDALEADKLLQDARNRLLNDRQSLQADLKQQIIVGERRMTAEGTYLSGAFPKLRLEYKIRVGTMQGSLLEICDNNVLHTEKTIGRVGATDPKDLDQQFTRRDVQKILTATQKAENQPVAFQAAELGIGGLPAMLASIDRCMVGKRITEEEFDGQICRVFHGVWDQAVLTKYDAALQDAKAGLVPFFPDKVQVFFAAESLVPVKFVYLKNHLDESAKVTGERTLMILELRNVKLDGPVSPTAFQFVLPSKREEIDRTNEFLELIQQADAALKGAPVPASGSKTSPD